MESLFEIKTKTFEADGFVLLHVAGQLDHAAAPHLEEAIRASAASDAGGPELILELSRVAFIDTSALAVIMGAASALDGRLSIIASPACMHVFEVTGVSARLPILISD